MRRHLTFGLAAVIAVGLVACGDDEPTASEQATEPADPVTADPSVTAPGDDSTEESVGSTATEPTTSAGAASSDWDAIVAAAEEEGSVMYYSPITPPAIEGIGAAFEQAYPNISFEYARELPADLQAKVDAELAAGTGIADVIASPNTIWLDQLTDQQQLVDLELPKVLASSFQPDWFKHGTYFLDAASPLGWAYNTDLLPAGLDDVNDFLAPELKGLVGIPEAASSDGVDVFRFLDEMYGGDFTAALAEQEPRIYASTVDIGEALAAGEIAATIHMSPVVAAGLQDAGAPIELFMPENARVTSVWAGIPVTAPHPNAAAVFANFLATAEASVGRGLFPGSLSLVEDVPDHRYAGDYALRDLSSITAEDVEEFRARFDELFR